jgi:LPPG:FO 2-phospho-L-lactate transferase
MARALRTVVDPGLLTVVVNVGDDTERYGVHVAADPDTVLHTLADDVGPHGWGRANDTFTIMEELDRHGIDTRFRLGDRDYGSCLARTTMLASGHTLSETLDVARMALGIDDLTVLPASDDPVRTWLRMMGTGEWIPFQEYFVDRSHDVDVDAVEYRGGAAAHPAPGVIAAIDGAETLVIAPSNPPLSIWPILAIDAVAEAVRRHPRTIAISPLFGGKPIKGPADRVMTGLGLPPGTSGVIEAYAGLIQCLFIDTADRADCDLADTAGVAVETVDTLLTGPDGGKACADAVVSWRPR